MGKIFRENVEKFFALNPFNRTKQDVIKLISDWKTYNHGFNENHDGDWQARTLVNVLIDSNKISFSNPPADYLVTPLMKVVSQFVSLGVSRFSYPALNLANAIKDVNTLLSEGADINATDCYGRTALMYVVLGGDIFKDELLIAMWSGIEIPKLLLDNGADPTIKDYLGKTALDYFMDAQKDHPSITSSKEIITLLEERMREYKSKPKPEPKPEEEPVKNLDVRSMQNLDVLATEIDKVISQLSKPNLASNRKQILLAHFNASISSFVDIAGHGEKRSGFVACPEWFSENKSKVEKWLTFLDPDNKNTTLLEGKLRRSKRPKF